MFSRSALNNLRRHQVTDSFGVFVSFETTNKQKPTTNTQLSALHWNFSILKPLEDLPGNILDLNGTKVAQLFLTITTCIRKIAAACPHQIRGSRSLRKRFTARLEAMKPNCDFITNSSVFKLGPACSSKSMDWMREKSASISMLLCNLNPLRHISGHKSHSSINNINYDFVLFGRKLTPNSYCK